MSWYKLKTHKKKPRADKLIYSTFRIYFYLKTYFQMIEYFLKILFVQFIHAKDQRYYRV